MGELVAVTTLDVRTIGSGAIGPMTKLLSELYAQETASSGFQILTPQPQG